MRLLNSLFDFSPSQLRFVSLLGATAVLAAGYLVVRTIAAPEPTRSNLPVYISDDAPVFTGIFVLDPNDAPADSLELLPGIGPALADRIVEYRSAHLFEHEIDITGVTGIGPRLYERLAPYLKVKRQ